MLNAACFTQGHECYLSLVWNPTDQISVFWIMKTDFSNFDVNQLGLGLRFNLGMFGKG